MSGAPVAMRRPVEPPLRLEPPAPPRRRRRHSRWPRIARIALPLLALGLAALIFAWSRINPVMERLQISETEEAPEAIESVTMENARLAGVDAEGRRYNVTAVRAIQSTDDSNHINLQQPKANIALANGSHVAIASESGGLQRDTQILDLFGAVTLKQDRGYEFRTTQARIDLNERTAAGDAPIEGTGPQGEIHAEGFEIVDGGASVIFRGKSRAVIRPQAEISTP